MRLRHFRSHRRYVAAQQSLTRRKIALGRDRVFCLPEVVAAIVAHHPGKIRKGICHGVRRGQEVDMFETAFGCGQWYGTEIVGELCDGERILHQDFDRIRHKWVHAFDFIYSNSFDHSRNPEQTLQNWLKCLSPQGRIYIEWTEWHNKLGNGRGKADCFAADAYEYLEMFSRMCQVDAVLPVAIEGAPRSIFVLRSKEPA